MKTIAAAVLFLLLAACANSPQPGEVSDDILAEMNRAAQRSPAVTPDAVNQSLLPPLRAEMPRVAPQPVEPRFDLAVNNAPAQQVFMSIVSGTRYSMVISPTVTGTISVNLKDVTVKEALEAIREVYGYEFRKDGTRIYIDAAGLQTRVFHVNYLVGLRTGRSDVRVSSGAISGNFTGTGAAPGALQGGGVPAMPGVPATNAGAPQPGQTTNVIGLSQLYQTTNDATRVSTFSQSDIWSEITNALRTLVGSESGRRIVVSPQSGVIVVRAMPQEIRSVESYLKAMRVSVERQVMIEAKIVDVTLSNAYQAGINWAAFPTNGITAGVTGSNTTLGTAGALSTAGASNTAVITADPASRTLTTHGTLGAGLAGTAVTASGAVGAGVFGLALQTKNFASLLQFLDSQGTVQVLSSPRVAAVNNQKAVLKVGTDQFFVTQVTSSTVSVSATQTGVTLTPTLSPFFSGVSLDITPQIDEDGDILLHIHPLVSNVDNSPLPFNFGTGIGSQDLQVARSTINETDTVVRVQDGNIVALGGLMKVDVANDRSGIPGLQDIPGLGGLFGNTTRTRTKRELVILLKPTVIKSEKEWEQDIAATGERMRGMGAGGSAPATEQK